MANRPHKTTDNHRSPASLIRLACLLALALCAASMQAQTTIYDDALENGFDGPNFSFGGGFDFNSVAQHHTGTKSISILGQNFNALSFAHVPGGILTALHTADTPVLRFWVNGGTASGQHFHIGLQNNGMPVGTAALLDTYINGGSVGLGVWRDVTIDLRQAPFNAINFDRIDIQSDQGATPDASATYFDDMTLGQPGAAPPVSSIQYGQGVTVSDMSSETFTWQDSLGHPRFAALAYNDTAPFMGTQGGALRQYRFQLSNGQTRTATVTTYGNAGYGGFGYVTLHSSRHPGGCNGDDSPLGLQFPGTWQRIFEGKHHAIFRFKQSYPRNCPTTGPVITRFLPVTIDWIFSTGHDNPVWAVTYDVDQISDGVNPPVGPNMYFDDSRAPYGELNIDGDGFSGDINGTSWGDRFKFIPTNAVGTSMTLNTPWTWNTPNTVPFVKEWLDGALGGAPAFNRDATMGIVLTQTMTQQDAGGARDPDVIQVDGTISDIRPYWNKTDANNVHGAGAFKVPNGDNWPYQANGDNLTGLAGSNNARLTWKTQYGFIGQSTYNLNDGVGTTAPGYPKKSYSTYVVLGQHSTVPDPIDAQMAQVVAVQSLTFAPTVGSVVTSGPAGNARADNVTYAPAGYNHVYGALAFSAAGNNLDMNISVGAGTLKKPLIIISNYASGADPQSVKLAAVALVADVDYFASVRAGASELWLTLNRDLSGPTNRLEITGATGGLTVPTNFAATATSTSQVTISWTAVAGAASYEIQRSVNINSGFTSLTTIVGTTFNDNALTANTTYLYKVRAISGATTSGFTSIDPATTILFTDNPLNAGVVARAVHITQLRTGVNAMRAAAGLSAQAFTDPALAANGRIKAVYCNELRSALDQARSAIGLVPPLVYVDQPIVAGVTTIKAVHVTGLRNGVK
jgi:hypothetical protein